MSKLDSIIWSAEYTAETQKQMIKDLMIELIGEDDTSASIPLGMSESVYDLLKAKDWLRDELRQKVNKL